MKQHLNEEHQKAALRVLVQTYLATFRSIGVETWLMHGSLLGWWWGKKVRHAQQRRSSLANFLTLWSDHALGF